MKFQPRPLINISAWETFLVIENSFRKQGIHEETAEEIFPEFQIQSLGLNIFKIRIKNYLISSLLFTPGFGRDNPVKNRYPVSPDRIFKIVAFKLDGCEIR